MNEDTIFAVLLFGAFVAIMLYISRRSFKKSRVMKDERGRLGAAMNATLKHTDGLPLAKGVAVDVYYGPEKIVFVKDKQEISISMDKITGIDCITGEDIKSQQMEGAAAGKYIIGGMTGALIGSLIATTTYLVISYNSNGTDKYVILDTAASGTFALKVKKDFMEHDTSETRSIEL